MSFEALPDGWRVWNEEPSGRAILVYRPDVFGGDDLPSECLPTIYLTNGARNARPGSGQYATEEWHVVLFLEPEIEAIAETYESPEAGAAAAVDVAGGSSPATWTTGPPIRCRGRSTSSG